MGLYKKGKNKEYDSSENNLSELPPLPEDNFSEEDLEEISEEELDNENEELREEVEEEEVPTPDYKKVQPKPTQKDIQKQIKVKPNTREVPVKEQGKEPKNFNEQIIEYLIELRDYSIKLEERINSLESFAFRIKSS